IARSGCRAIGVAAARSRIVGHARVRCRVTVVAVDAPDGYAITDGARSIGSARRTGSAVLRIAAPNDVAAAAGAAGAGGLARSRRIAVDYAVIAGDAVPNRAVARLALAVGAARLVVRAVTRLRALRWAPRADAAAGAAAGAEAVAVFVVVDRAPRERAR